MKNNFVTFNPNAIKKKSKNILVCPTHNGYGASSHSACDVIPKPMRSSSRDT